MLRPWLYERDAVTVLARRNEALAAMHSEAMIRRFESDLDALESFVERYLSGGELRERLDSLPLDLDPTMQVIEETVNALKTVRHHHPDVAPAAQEQAISRLLAALEEACEQVEFPREHWSGRFDPNYRPPTQANRSVDAEPRDEAEEGLARPAAAGGDAP